MLGGGEKFCERSEQKNFLVLFFLVSLRGDQKLMSLLWGDVSPPKGGTSKEGRQSPLQGRMTIFHSSEAPMEGTTCPLKWRGPIIPQKGTVKNRSVIKRQSCRLSVKKTSVKIQLYSITMIRI